MPLQPRHTPHWTLEKCVARYPLLTRALQWVLIGTEGEAGCVLRDYRDGLDFSCEACSHSGLTPLDRIRHASSDFTRRIVREQYREAKRERQRRIDAARLAAYQLAGTVPTY